MECVFFSGKKINSKLLFTTEENMIYKKKSFYKGVIKFECWRSDCKARVNYMPDGTCIPAKHSPAHNHSHQKDDYKMLCALNKIKKETANIAGVLGGELSAISGVRTAFRNVAKV